MIRSNRSDVLIQGIDVVINDVDDPDTPEQELAIETEGGNLLIAAIGVHMLMAALVVFGTMNWQPFKKEQPVAIAIEAVIVDTSEIKKQRDEARRAQEMQERRQQRADMLEQQRQREAEEKRQAEADAARRQRELEAQRKRDAEDRLKQLRLQRERKLEEERLKQQRELDALPAMIEQLENEQAALQATIGEAGFYQQPHEQVSTVLQRLQAVEDELEHCFGRWEALESGED